MLSLQRVAKHTAIVIGAGISGLQMADLLQKKGFGVTILEAKDYVGGRIKEERTFADFPIELGGEAVHGETSLHYKIAQKYGVDMVDSSEFSCYVEYKNKLYGEEDLEEKCPDISRVFELDWEEITNYKGEKDIALSDYIKEHGFSPELHYSIDAIIAREWATDIENLSVKGIQRWNVDWGFGERDFILKDQSHTELFKKEYENVCDKVQLNTPVAKVTYGQNQQVVVQDKTGNTYTGDLAVISVPISQLKKEKIQFEPALPEKKREAIQQVNMDPAMKVFIKFNKRIWNEDLGFIITEGVSRIVWSSSGGGKSEKCHVLTSLISGKVAERLSKLEDKEIINEVLEDFKRIFGEKIVEEEFAGGFVQDWTKEEYIEGGYTYPHINETSETRRLIAEPVDNQIYFVGEATSGRFSLISAAIESSYRAYKEICIKYLKESEC